MISEALAWLNPYKWLAIAVVALALAGVIGGQHLRIGSLNNRLDKANADLTQAKKLAVDLNVQFRAAEASWAKTQKEDLDAHQAQVTRLAADKAIADAAAGKLRQRVADLVAHAREAAAHPSAAAASASTDDPIGVLADVLERADARAGSMAAIADARGAAGELCEKLYDSLK